MIIFNIYLTIIAIQPPVLPSLQRIYGMKFSVDTNIEYVHMHEQLPCSGWKSDNKQSIGDLLLEFFSYYNDFKLVDIRNIIFIIHIVNILFLTGIYFICIHYIILIKQNLNFQDYKNSL